MRAKMYLKKPTGRRRRPMKILPHPAPRQIPSNSVKFWRPVGPPRQSRQIPAAPRAPVKFRQIPSKYGPRSGPYYPPLGFTV